MNAPVQVDNTRSAAASGHLQAPRARPRPASLVYGRKCRIASGLRVHPVPRLNMCLVRGPNAQTVHTLNRSAWRLLELCALGDEQRIHAIFVHGSERKGRVASEKFEQLLGELVARQLVVVDDETTAV